MSAIPVLVRSLEVSGLRTVFDMSGIGYLRYSTASLPDRVYVGLDSAQRPSSIFTEPAIDLDPLPSPLEVLAGDKGVLPSATRASLKRLEALWLLIEDRHNLLDTATIEPLAHQASLVEHILSNDSLRRVLIADEVGLGKTIEAGLIIKSLTEASGNAPPRVLYLAPAALVDNVAEELERLGLQPRRWASDAQEATLKKDWYEHLVVASIHRAVVSTDSVDHRETFLQSGPWDMIVVDEAHHLSDWSVAGTSPKRRMALVKDLVEQRLNPQGRVLLMTATPHQGHGPRFQNLLRLLSEDGKPDGAKGKIVYRIKEDIKDWDGNPLFPVRRIKKPTAVVVGEDYHAWMKSIAALFSSTGDQEASRAQGWRKAQALQWSASSPLAGLAYLTRYALRCGFTEQTLEGLGSALETLRPYRGGSPDEPIVDLRERLLRQTRSEDGADEAADPAELSRVLEEGVQVVRSGAFNAKLQHIFDWLDAHPDEKFVVFAQPVETVFALRDRIEARLGPGSVALVVGDQTRDQRKAQIAEFRRVRGGCRVLVSSSSGGEGINLQVSRRLIHFDVPWNPMDLEQRVGRVHRYGSTETVIVETLVLDRSREQDVLRRCQARLGEIAQSLDSSRAAELFSRTMSQIPYEELAEIMAGEGFGEMSDAEVARLNAIVTKGFEEWQAADKQFRETAIQIRDADRGQTTEDDLRSFVERMGGVSLDGWKRLTMVDVPDGEPRRQEQPAEVYQLPDGTRGFLGRSAGVGLIDDEGDEQRIERIGLNAPVVAEALRAWVAEDARSGVAGAASCLVDARAWAELVERYELPDSMARGAVVAIYCVRRIDAQTPRQREVAVELISECLSPTGDEAVRAKPRLLADLIRLLRTPRPKRTVPALDRARLVERERAVVDELRSSQPGEPLRAIFPLTAIWCEPEG